MAQTSLGEGGTGQIVTGVVICLEIRTAIAKIIQPGLQSYRQRHTPSPGAASAEKTPGKFWGSLRKPGAKIRTGKKTTKAMSPPSVQN
jgi:hypothetical protein